MAAPVDGVAVRTGLPNKGKALFAVKMFSKDEVLFEEKPLVSSQFNWNALYRYLACDHCMKSLETAEEMARRLSENPALVLPYPQCCQVQKDQHTVCPHCQIMYCSSSCRDTAWLQYHQSLCMGPSTQDQEHPLNRLQETWRNMHYPPETTSIMLIARMIGMIRQAKDKEAIKRMFAQFCRATVNEEEEIAHKLLGQQFKDQQEVLRPVLAEALFDEEVQQWFTPGGFQSLLALIGTNGQGIGTSSVGVWAHSCEKLPLSEEEKATLDAFIDQLYMDMDKVSGQFLNCEGSGLYVLQSACNHSCVPNAEISFPYNDSTLVVKTLEKIQEGEEVFISYLDECDRERSRHSRHKILRENYLFTCSCAKCESEAEDPDVTSEEEDGEWDDDDDDEMEDQDH